MSDVSGPSRFDAGYFEKWYRASGSRVITPVRIWRKAKLAVAMAEYYLRRPVRNALDIGCGEGQWRSALRKMCPGIRYCGVDPSPYVTDRYGVRRNILRGSFGALPEIEPLYDLIIASDALYYVPEDELTSGLRELVPRLTGVAFLEAYGTGAELEGDTAGMIPRPAGEYRRIFREAGLVSCGSHCYVGPALADQVTELERGG